MLLEFWRVAPRCAVEVLVCIYKWDVDCVSKARPSLKNGKDLTDILSSKVTWWPLVWSLQFTVYLATGWFWWRKCHSSSESPYIHITHSVLQQSHGFCWKLKKEAISGHGHWSPALLFWAVVPTQQLIYLAFTIPPSCRSTAWFLPGQWAVFVHHIGEERSCFWRDRYKYC